jgi:hypothetical protein
MASELEMSAFGENVSNSAIELLYHNIMGKNSNIFLQEKKKYNQ